jgi:hypothetical protein
VPVLFDPAAAVVEPQRVEPDHGRRGEPAGAQRVGLAGVLTGQHPAGDHRENPECQQHGGREARRLAVVAAGEHRENDDTAGDRDQTDHYEQQAVHRFCSAMPAASVSNTAVSTRFETQ